MDRAKQLYYKKGRRYIEYTKFDSIPNNKLYFYDGDELVPFNEDSMSWFAYSGLPSPGIWVVRDNGCTRIGDYDITDMRIELEKYQDIMVKAVSLALDNCEGKYVSRSDIAREILNNIEKLDNERKINIK